MPLLDSYLLAQDLTRRMLDAARRQEWDTLSALEAERSRLIENIGSEPLNVSGAEKDRISRIVLDIARDSKEVMEQVENWQKDVQILLRTESYSA